MEKHKDTRAGAPRQPGRRVRCAGPLLLVILTALLAVPSASAAPGSATPEVVSEVAATAGSTAEPVTAPVSSAPLPEPAAAPAPQPSPVPEPAAVVKSPATAVDRSLASSSSSGAVPAVRAPVEQVAQKTTEIVSAVAGESGAAHVRAVEETTRRPGDAVGTLAGGVAEGARAVEGSQNPTPERAPEAGNPAAENEHAGPAPQRGRVDLPSPAPLPTSNPFAPPLPGGDIHAAAPTSAPALPDAAAIVPGSVEATASVLTSETPATTPAGPRQTPVPTVPALPIGGAASSAPAGGGGGSFLLLFLGVLALFALAVPSIRLRLLAAGSRYRPAPFICALERPG